MRKNNREIILKTARETFLKKGFSDTSIRGIAEKAKLTTGAIYFHFKNKKDIYKTICIEAMEVLTEKFIKGKDSKMTHAQKIISTHDSYIEFFNDNNDYYNILMEYKSAYNNSDKEEDSANGEDEIRRMMSNIVRIAEDQIKDAIKDGYYNEIDPKMLSVLLASITEGMLHYKKLGVLEYLDISDNDFRKFMADVIGNGILKK